MVVPTKKVSLILIFLTRVVPFLVIICMLKYPYVIQRVVGKLTQNSFPNNNEDHELEL